MGGGAFAHAVAPSEPTLNTPRMSPQEYANIKLIYLKRLQDYFSGCRVVCLTEAPEKADYGDMDLFVAFDQIVNFVDMANHLGAVGVICHGSSKFTLGVPKTNVPNSRPVVVYKHVHGNRAQNFDRSTAATDEEYAQIDVDIIPSQLLDWYTFYSAYGDMAGLLGHIVRNFGFTVSDRGLKLRMKELDFSKTVLHVNIADRDGTIFLSHDPRLVMRFLGLTVERYDAGFDTMDEFYGWLGACRLLSAEAIKLKRDNAHERNREQKRTVFSNFFNEWLPARMDLDVEQKQLNRPDSLQSLRQKYLDEAIDFFGKRDEYVAKHDRVVLTINCDMAANLLKPLVAQHSQKEGKLLNEIMRAFRRYVGFEANGQPCVLGAAHSDFESQLYQFLAVDGVSLRDPKSTNEWVREHWEELRALERRRMKANANENV